MTVSKKDLELEVLSLKKLGLTEEDIEGYLEFYKDVFQIEKPKSIRVINTKKRNVN